MLPNPLHAAVVHFPIVLAMVLPLFALGSLYAIRRGAKPTTAWGITAIMSAALLLASWASLETGEAEEEKVEDVVSESLIGGHEEAAQLFTMVAGGVLLITLAGFAKGKIGTGARVAATVASVAVVAAGFNVGHSGGQLVYKYGAGSAYTANAASERGAPNSGESRAPARSREKSEKEGATRSGDDDDR